MMLTSGDIPRWAMALVEKVCAEEQVKLPKRFTWRQRADDLSGGCYYPTDHWLSMAAGLSQRDQRLVLLHELAHLVHGHSHSDDFWLVAWRLFRRHRVPIAYALKREGEYKKRSVAVYHQLRRSA